MSLNTGHIFFIVDEDLIKYGWPEDIWYIPIVFFNALPSAKSPNVLFHLPEIICKVDILT